MRASGSRLLLPLVLLVLPLTPARGQGTVPTFQVTVGAGTEGEGTFTLVGRDPARGGKTTIATRLVPVALTFDTRQGGGRTFVFDAAAHVPRLRRSPIFADFAFPEGGKTQYVDAMLRATFPAAGKWHTRLGKPQVQPLRIAVPAGSGYVLTSKASGGAAIAVVDLEWLQGQLAARLRGQQDKLVIAVTLNTTFYADGDATICCSWGTHGVDRATGTSFVLGSILDGAPAVVTDADLQPLTQQLAQFVKDPLNDPLAPHRRRRRDDDSANNRVPGWMRPWDMGGCGGSGVASSYFRSPPTRTRRTTSPPRRPTSPPPARRPTACTTSPSCRGTPVPPATWAASTASPTHGCCQPPPSHVPPAAGGAAAAAARGGQRPTPCSPCRAATATTATA